MTERASNNLLVFDLRWPEPPVIRSHAPKEQKWLNKSMLAFPGTQHEARQNLSASSQRLPHIMLCKRQTLDFSHTHYLAVLQILNATETACQAQPHTQHFLTLFSCPRNWHFGSAVPKGDFPSTSMECPASGLALFSLKQNVKPPIRWQTAKAKSNTNVHTNHTDWRNQQIFPTQLDLRIISASRKQYYEVKHRLMKTDSTDNTLYFTNFVRFFFPCSN